MDIQISLSLNFVNLSLSKVFKYISLVVLVLGVVSITLQTTITCLNKTGCSDKNLSIQQPLTEEEESQDTDEFGDEEVLFFENPLAYFALQHIRPFYGVYVQLIFPDNYDTIQIPPPKA